MKMTMSNTSPGIYLVNATGEMVALAVEDGTGDRQLLVESLKEIALEEDNDS